MTDSQSRHRRSALITTLLTVVMLLVGWTVKSDIESSTRPFSSQGLQAHVPEQWLISAPAENPGTLGEEDLDPTLVLLTWDPLHTDTRYLVRLLPAGAEVEAASLAAFTNLQRGQSFNTYRVLAQTTVALYGKPAYKVSYAYVLASDPGTKPVVIEGVDFYLPGSDQTLQLSLESVDSDFAEAYPAFLDFIAGVEVGE